MKMKLFMTVLSAAVALGAVGSAQAADGCGPAFHRGPYGGCRPNYGPRFVGPGPVVGVFYPGHGYWYGGRYWGHRYWHGGAWGYR